MLCLCSLLKKKGPPCLWLQDVYGLINSLVSLVFLIFGLTGDVKTLIVRKKSMAMLCLWSLLKEKGPPCLWLQNVYGSINSS